MRGLDIWLLSSYEVIIATITVTCPTDGGIKAPNLISLDTSPPLHIVEAYFFHDAQNHGPDIAVTLLFPYWLTGMGCLASPTV